MQARVRSPESSTNKELSFVDLLRNGGAPPRAQIFPSGGPLPAGPRLPPSRSALAQLEVRRTHLRLPSRPHHYHSTTRGTRPRGHRHRRRPRPRDNLSGRETTCRAAGLVMERGDKKGEIGRKVPPPSSSSASPPSPIAHFDLRFWPSIHDLVVPTRTSQTSPSEISRISPFSFVSQPGAPPRPV